MYFPFFNMNEMNTCIFICPSAYLALEWNTSISLCHIQFERLDSPTPNSLVDVSHTISEYRPNLICGSNNNITNVK